MVAVGGDQDHGPWEARWKTGAAEITISPPRAGTQAVMDVPAGRLEPDPAWLRGSPLCVYPGGRWEEHPGGFAGEHRVAMPPVWTILVFPESPQVTSHLTTSTANVIS